MVNCQHLLSTFSIYFQFVLSGRWSWQKHPAECVMKTGTVIYFWGQLQLMRIGFYHLDETGRTTGVLIIGVCEGTWRMSVSGRWQGFICQPPVYVSVPSPRWQRCNQSLRSPTETKRSSMHINHSFSGIIMRHDDMPLGLGQPYYTLTHRYTQPSPKICNAWANKCLAPVFCFKDDLLDICSINSNCRVAQHIPLKNCHKEMFNSRTTLLMYKIVLPCNKAKYFCIQSRCILFHCKA